MTSVFSVEATNCIFSQIMCLPKMHLCQKCLERHTQIKRLLEGDYHEWKVITLHLIKTLSNLDINLYFLYPAAVNLTIISKFLWFNIHIKTDG